jgi:CubicO group peptidase (beta-lactamase class C family)
MYYLALFLSLWIFSIHSQEGASANKMKALLGDYENYVNRTMEVWNVPGLAITIVNDNEVVFTKGFGVKKIGGQDKVDNSTLFQIGSLTKSFTSALVALMVDEGRLKWNDKIINHYSEFMLYDPWVTREFEVQDLLSQRSGLPPFAGDFQTFLGFNSRQIIHNLRYIKPVTSFRSAYSFQNAFFNVVAEVLLSATGRSWDELIQERLFSPLAMNNSSSSAEALTSSKNVAGRHIHAQKKTILLPSNDPALAAVYTYAPAGGINSTIVDMSQWLKFQIQKGVFNGTPLISKENLEQTHRRYIYMGKYWGSDQYYGLGWAIRDYAPYPIIWNEGSTDGSSSLIAFIPEERIGIVILSNTAGTSLNYALAWEFFDRFFERKKTAWSEELLEKQIAADEQALTPTPPEKSEPPLNLNDYEGIYYNKMYGKAVVTQDQSQLFITIGPKKERLNLKHWNRDTFVLTWPQVTDLSNTKVFFTKNIKGYPTQMIVEILEKNSDGTFQRLGEEE